MSKRGFTLIEILIAMSLFTVLGFATVLLMRTGVDMWLTGTRASVQEDQSEEGRPRLQEDLRHVLVPIQHDRIPFDPKNPDPEKEPPALPPLNRFVSGYMVYRFGEEDIKCRYLAFVRDIVGLPEIDLYVDRAGMNPKAESYIDGKKDEEEFEKKDHLPTGGKVEVLWIWLPDSDDTPGIGTVYRAYRSPIGGKDSLLDITNYDSLRKLRKIIQPQPMLEGVILFDMLFWTQFTTTWEWSRGDPKVTERPRSADEVKDGPQPCGPSRIWDSTRGLLLDRGELGFSLNKGKESFNYSADDIWPRAVRIEFARAEERTFLSRGLASNDQDFVLESSTFAMGRGELFGKLMKVGAEWIRIQGRAGAQTDTFLVDRRGERGSSTLAHPEGTPVYFGRVQDFTIFIPAFRDDNN